MVGLQAGLMYWKLNLVMPASSLIRSAVYAGLLLAVGYCGAFWLLRNPVSVPDGSVTDVAANPDRLEADVRFLSASQPARSFENVAALDAAAKHIQDEFTATGCRSERQSFQVGDNTYHNIICSYGPPAASRLIIGAHYDVAGHGNPGADDNASGVAGILELARMLKLKSPELKHRLDLVAYSLEEPPNFRTRNMGSYFHAAQLKEKQVDVRLSISVEMIGYFSDDEGSQTYPLSILKLFYPDKADFIGVIGSTFDRNNVARVKTLMQVRPQLPVYSINAPSVVPGIDYSDHWSFWQHGLPAIMVTDTAFLRNPNYHQPSDTPDTLDYIRMAMVVDGLYRVAVDY